MIEMAVDSIRVSLMNYQRVVILKEKETSRYLPIWIGASEADAIAVKLQGTSVLRPLTHDLMQSVIDNLGGKVTSIIISDLQKDVFFAKVVLLNRDNEQLEIDSRPSDAIALAVRVQAPIYAEEDVLNRGGVWLDKETGKPVAEDTEPMANNEGKQVIDEEMKKKASAFYDYINKIDLDDFGKRKS
jgi:bifunctional DNase/RNase